MARRTLNRYELRAAAEAAESRGLKPSPKRPQKTGPAEHRLQQTVAVRLKVVWAVCDVGGRTVAKFDYPRKSEADTFAAQLQSQGKGKHFVRSIKEPMSAG
jgi:hypothetical protein